MKRSKSATFTVEFPLTLTRAAQSEALVRFELGRELHNACLDEGFRRFDLMCQSKAWAKAGVPVAGETKTGRSKRYAAVRELLGVTSASLSAFATRHKNDAGWNRHLGAHETQRIAEHVFEALEQHLFGKRGRPRFKGKGRPLHSLEGKSEGSGLRWNKETGCLYWSGLVIPAMIPSLPKDKHGYLAQALAARTKYARVLWRMIKGKRRFFVQLVQEGLAPMKYQAPAGTVGADVGPSMIAVYSERGVALVPLCPEIEEPWAQTKRLRRKMDRSRRATNPECYEKDGTFKKGAKITVRSKCYEKDRAALAEAERMKTETRERSHGRLANCIVGLGNTVKAERLSYRSFQKCFGRSVKVRAPALLMDMIRRKAERAGGELVDLNAQALKLSQYDHTTETCTKKPLSERWHVLGDNSGVVQRDLYSAFLAAQAAGDAIHSSQVREAWPVAQSLLVRAGWMRDKSVSVASVLAAAPALPAPERVARKRVLVGAKAQDAVAATREPARLAESALIL